MMLAIVMNIVLVLLVLVSDDCAGDSDGAGNSVDCGNYFDFDDGDVDDHRDGDGDGDGDIDGVDIGDGDGC